MMRDLYRDNLIQNIPDWMKSASRWIPLDKNKEPLINKDGVLWSFAEGIQELGSTIDEHKAVYLGFVIGEGWGSYDFKEIQGTNVHHFKDIYLERKNKDTNHLIGKYADTEEAKMIAEGLNLRIVHPITGIPLTASYTEQICGISVHTVSSMANDSYSQDSNPSDIISHFKPLSNESNKPLVEKQYIYKPYFPLGKFSIITADPGTGKTKLVDAIAAAITTGKPLINLPCNHPGKVLIFSMEDDIDDHKATIANCGGNLNNVILPGQEDEDIEFFSRKKLTFSSPEIEYLIDYYRPVLVIFDPYQKYVGSKTDINTANKLSEALTPLTLLPRKYNCHILVVAHNIKAQTNKLQYKFMGSVDFVGEARSAIMIVRDPERIEQHENIMIHIKSNNKLGKSIRYRIDSIPGNEDYATVAFLGFEDYSERDYMLSNRTALQSKANALNELSDDDPTIKMILSIMCSNPTMEEIRIGIHDFGQCYYSFNGSWLREPVTKEIKRIQEYMEQAHGFLIKCVDSRSLMIFNFMGKPFSPCSTSSRCVKIIRSTMARIKSEQQHIKDV